MPLLKDSRVLKYAIAGVFLHTVGIGLAAFALVRGLSLTAKVEKCVAEVQEKELFNPWRYCTDQHRSET